MFAILREAHFLSEDSEDPNYHESKGLLALEGTDLWNVGGQSCSGPAWEEKGGGPHHWEGLMMRENLPPTIRFQFYSRAHASNQWTQLWGFSDF